MRKIPKTLSITLAILLLTQAVLLPVSAYQKETTAPATEPTAATAAAASLETTPVTDPTEPSASAETQPEPTVPEETQPQETKPFRMITMPEIPQPQEPDPITEIPLYYQTDYPTTRYGAGTIDNSGCGIVSLAMVATYLTGQEYLPDQLAAWFGGNGNNNIERLEYGATAMQLPFTSNTNWHVTREALKEGKIAIILVNNKSQFTTSQHFLVVTGMTEDGRYRINDSYKPNYDRWDLKDGFANGFEEWQLDCGFCGAWVFDPEAMPEEPFLYFEEPYDYDSSRYGYGFRLTPEELDLIMRVVWVEAQGEPFEGQQAVAEVVLNRLVSEGFADNIRDVVYGPGQFNSSPFLKDAEPNQTQYDAVMAALYGESILPMECTYFSTYPTSSQVVAEIGNHIFCIPD